MDRLHRIRLLFGNENIAKLQTKTVMVVGCGAVGSFAIEAIARSGIGHIIIVDFDKVEPTNINRQLFALNTTIGMPKVDVARARIGEISPDINVTAFNMFWDENTSPDVAPDFVIDAIDSVPSKIALYKWCASKNIPFIASMGAAQKTDMSQIKTGTISKTTVCPLAAKIRKLIKNENLPDFPVVYSTQSPIKNDTGTLGSMITVTGDFGLRLANYVIQYLISK
jgi:tRNA A37 threonylcarbamoyladenosine dehydratase